MPAASQSEEQEPHSKVLVVDTDPGLLEWLEVALNRRHVSCCCALTARKAFTMLDKEQPNVVFIDADVPGMHIAEEIARFHEVLRHPAPIYLMTGLAKADTAHRHVAGVLRKPFQIEEMLKLILASTPPAEKLETVGAP
jgi:DNA-binding NtrC family response regulator